MDEALTNTMASVEDSHWWYVARRELLLTVAGNHLSRPPASVLDLGCGTGGNLSAFRSAFGCERAAGLDRQPTCIEACTSKGLEVVPGDVTALPFGDGEFEFVSTLDVLEHVEEGLAVSELARVLAPGGMAMITVPAYDWLWGPHDELNAHQRRYTRDRLVRALERGNLAVSYATYFNTYLFPLGATVRLIERLSGRHGGEDGLPPPVLNSVLLRAFRAECRVIGRGGTLPYGLSILAVARRR